MKEVLGMMKNSKEKNMCWQDGRLFDDKEDWVVDSCTKCTCQVAPSNVETSLDLLWTSVTYISLMAGVQDRVSPDHMPPGVLCHPLVCGGRVLPPVHA